MHESLGLCHQITNKEENQLKFKNYDKRLKVPFVIYADCEAILEKNIENGPSNATRHHDIFSIGYNLKCSYDDSLSRYKFNRGPDCASWFANELREIGDRVREVRKKIEDMVWTDSERLRHYRATDCHICKVDFNYGEKRARDHCHLTGKSKNYNFLKKFF